MSSNNQYSCERLFKTVGFSSLFFANLIFLPSAAFAQQHPIPGKTVYAQGSTDCNFETYKKCGPRTGYHLGLDYMASGGPESNKGKGTSVYAMCDGVVKAPYANQINVKASVLVIQHQCADRTFYGYYGHIWSGFNKVGMTVKEGEKIGTVRYYPFNGKDNSHLHLGVSGIQKKDDLQIGFGYNARGIGEFFNPLEILLAPPKLSQIRARNNKIAVTWQKRKNVTQYRVQIAKKDSEFSRQSGLRNAIVNSTKVVEAKTVFGFGSETLPKGTYMVTIQAIVDGKPTYYSEPRYAYIT